MQSNNKNITIENKSFAEKYWREFEELAFLFCKNQFGYPPDFAKLTQAQGDGGYDGKFVRQITKAGKADGLEQIVHTILMEAKLRSPGASVGLRDFSASVLISFNIAAHTLIIITNGEFSPQALEEIYRFKHKTNLDVRLVNGATIGGWINININLIKNGFSSELLTELSNFANKNKKIYKHTIKFNTVSRDNITEVFNITSNAYVNLGWDGSKIAECELMLEKTSTKDIEHCHKISFSKDRENLVGSIANDFLSRPKEKIKVLKGTAGIGKSIITSNILNILQQNNFKCAILTLDASMTSRMLFLKMYEVLSGIDIEMFIDSETGNFEVEEFVWHPTTGLVSPEMKSAIVGILHNDIRHYIGQSDLYYHVLAKYIGILATPYAKNSSILLAFQELNAATKETLDFLFVIIKQLANSGVYTLLELRDNGKIHNFLEYSNWEEHLKRFIGVGENSLGVETVKAFTKEEAASYLEELLPGFDAKRCAFICERVGNIPFFLEASANWLKAQKIIEGEDYRYFRLEKLEVFFGGFTPNKCQAVIDGLLNIYKTVIEPISYMNAIVAASLLDGNIHLLALEKLFPQHSSTETIRILVGSGIFIDSGNGLKIIHTLMLDRMKDIIASYDTIKKQVAKILLAVLDDIYTEPHKRLLKKVDLNYAAQEWYLASTDGLLLGKNLIRQKDFVQALRCLDLSYKAYSMLHDSQEKKIGKIRSLSEYLEASSQLHYITGNIELNKAQEFSKLLSSDAEHNAELNVLLGFSRDLEDVLDYPELKVRSELYQWHAYFKQANIEKASSSAYRAIELVNKYKNNNQVKEDIKGQAYGAYALCMKEKGEMDLTIEYFKEGMIAFPKSYTLKAEYLSHLGFLSLATKPQISAQHYNELLETIRGTDFSFLESLHARIDVAMALLYAKEYDKAKKLSIEGIRIAQDNGIFAEEGRALNLLGAVFWINGDLRSALKCFQEACCKLEESCANIYLWRARTNYAVALAQDEQYMNALSLLESAIGAITEYNTSRLEKIMSTDLYYNERLYAALISIYRSLIAIEKSTDYTVLTTPLKEKIKRLPLQNAEKDVNKLDDGLLPDALRQTAYLHGNLIIVTG